jgi:nitrite reductase/ring-hydroxylating ferredoxin subunit
MTKTIAVAKLADIQPGGSLIVEAEGISVALFNVDGTIYALDNSCPHAGGPLGEGYLENDVVVCPWHRWRYCVRTGHKVGNPEITVPCYGVETQGDQISLIIPVYPPGGGP